MRENQLMGESKDFEHNRHDELIRKSTWRIAVAFAGTKGMTSPNKLWKTPYEHILGPIKGNKPHTRQDAQRFVDRIHNMKLR